MSLFWLMVLDLFWLGVVGCRMIGAGLVLLVLAGGVGLVLVVWCFCLAWAAACLVVVWVGPGFLVFWALWTGVPRWFGVVFGLFLFGEFDPGSGRTLAACLTHASRTVKLLAFVGGG